jgi:hypothetical protein
VQFEGVAVVGVFAEGAEVPAEVDVDDEGAVVLEVVVEGLQVGGGVAEGLEAAEEEGLGGGVEFLAVVV